MESLIAELLSGEILRNIEIEKAIVTITSVNVSEDLENAAVTVAVFPDTERTAVLAKLKAQAPKLQHALNKKISIKSSPRIEFK